MTLPVNTTRANKFLSFNSSGNPQAVDSIGTYKGNWSTGVAYVLQDVVKDTSNNNIYICITAHTSTGSQPISSNADVAKWSLIVDAASATTSATNAAASASAASTSATNAAASYDSFDDRYLGSKSSAPSVDNDGNALLTGALYWNSTVNQLYIWTGTAWNTGTSTAFTTGSVIFAGASGVFSQDNANFFWDDTNNYLGIATASPSAFCHTVGPGVGFKHTNGAITMQMYADSVNGVVESINTPLFSQTTGANPYIISTNTTERVRIDATGNVGIGTSVPTVTLDVRSPAASGANADVAYFMNPVNNVLATAATIKIGATSVATRYAYIQSLVSSGVNGQSLCFGTNANGATPTEKMRITDAGNVGIGTTSPAAKLEVQGSVIIGNATAGGALTMPDLAGNPTIQLVTDTATAGQSAIVNNWANSSNIGIVVGTARSDGAAFQVQTAIPITSGLPSGAGTTALYVGGNGNVGIGTTSPTVKLDVIGSIEASPAATQDAIIIAGRAGGTSSYAATLTPTTLTASRTITIPDATTTMVGTDTTQTLTNKRVTPRVDTTTSSGTPTINTDNVDIYGLTAQAADITSFTTNLSGTPTDGQRLHIYIVGTAARAITWGASFESSSVMLPSTTVTTNRLDVGFVWNAATSKWRCVAVA
jgi:hypothetical protein